jgi:natural product biosynthesis luciferase-like monooxygenase protein
MKKVVSLIYELKNKGLKVELDADALNIKVKGNTHLLSDEEKKSLISLKPEIIRFLNDNQTKKVAHTSIPSIPKSTDYAVSSAQQRLWVLSQFAASNTAYSMPAALLVNGLLNNDLLNAAFFQMVARYEILRTVFNINEFGEVRQYVKPIKEFDFSIGFHDLQSEKDIDKVLQEKLRSAEVTPFDLANGPLFNAALYQLDSDRQVLFVNIHHIICDGTSMEMFLEEVFTGYKALTTGEAIELPELRVQYKDYAHWQREQLNAANLAAHREYWLNQFSDKLPILTLPSDRERPAVMTYNGSSVIGSVSKATTQQLKTLVQAHGGTLFMGLLAGMKALFYKYTGDEDIIIGTPVSGREHIDLENQLGLFLNMLALRTRFNGTQSFDDLLQQVKKTTLTAYQYQAYPFDQLVSELDLGRDASRSALFDVMLVMHNNRNQQSAKDVAGLPISTYPMNQVYSKFDYTFNFTENNDQIDFAIEYNTDIYSREQAEQMAAHYEHLLAYVVNNSNQPISGVAYLSEEEQQQILVEFNNTEQAYDIEKTLLHCFAEQVQCNPNDTAVIYGDKSLTYFELNEKANQLANHLLKTGVHKGDLIGIYVERSLDMMVGLFAILKSGAAYVPLDPSYPKDRIAYIIENAGINMIVTQPKWSAQLSGFRIHQVIIDHAYEQVVSSPDIVIHPQDLAYVIYTSGSTGRPKGVMVTHGNVSNFLAAMTKEIGSKKKGDSLLAVTTISFDISVLELFWTLANGFKVVIAPSLNKLSGTEVANKSTKKMDFSLFYFASEVDYNNKYKLLIEGAKFGDTHGFSAIWTPERHFHEFGGVYPNPAITGAAIATITKNIHIRSGSCVLPLHNPIRVAEEWSVVDNLSNGRVGLSFASGWVMNDFLAFAPNRFDNRQETMYNGIEQVRSLWEGNPIKLSNPNGADANVEIFPKPIQKKLPVWVTAADNPETFRTAGKMGANLLTHLLGQTIEELKEKIKIYRVAYNEAGYEGDGHVTLMIHTFIDEDAKTVKEKVKGPFTNYLRNASGLVRTLAKSMGQDVNAETFSEEDMEALLAHAFNRYYDTAALFGTPDSCLDMVNKLSHAGVDELGCLVDFGLDVSTTLNGFQQLNVLKDLYASQADTKQNASPLQLIKEHGITHLQCTPSALKMMLMEEDAGSSLQSLTKLMVGGEPFPVSLLLQLQSLSAADIHNMYGPTETTVWSTTANLTHADKVTIGRPIANTQVYLLDQHQRIVPIGVVGELYIGGQGVTAGYRNAPELTAERFISNQYVAGGTLYKTGDMGKWTSDGRIILLGRKDDQVKVRGYRVETGEIEAALRKNSAINDAVVKASMNKNGDYELVAYIITPEELDVTTVRSELSKTLPDYMIPSRLVQLDALPLTPNGKVDKLALPDIEGASMATGVAYLPPRTELENELVGLWADVLGLEPETIGVLDNFFELGGHSLNAVRLIGLIKLQIGVKIELQVLFYTPTIEELAHEIEMVQWANRQAEVQHADKKKTKVRI